MDGAILMDTDILYPKINSKLDYTRYNEYIYVNYRKKLPYQGFKIHISSHLDNAQRILDYVGKVCEEYGATYKYQSTKKNLFKIINKGTNPIEIGKFITIYPDNKNMFLLLLESLNKTLSNEEGPVILTDRPYKDSKIIFYRYGVMQCNDSSIKRPLIYDSNGNSYPDIVGPYYTCPEFINDPFGEWIPDENDLLLNYRYQPLEIIHQTGAGNVYLAQDLETKKLVVIKEARAWIYLNEDITAIESLMNEKRILCAINKSYVSKYVDDFFLENNYYLAIEYISGQQLLNSSLSQIILLEENGDKKISDKIDNLTGKLFRQLKDLHEAGIIWEDISLTNILEDKKGNLFFIDFEAAYFEYENILYQTKNCLIPEKIKGSKKRRDLKKLAYCLIGLFTNAGSLAPYDCKGQSTRALFYKMVRETGQGILLKNYCDELFQDEVLGNKLGILRHETYKETFRISDLVFWREKLLSYLNENLTLIVEGKDILEELINVKAIKQFGSIPSKCITIQQIEFQQLDTIDYHLALLEIGNGEVAELFKETLNQCTLDSFSYRQKLHFIRHFNQNHKNKDYLELLFLHIWECDIGYYKGTALVQKDGYFNPYYDNGSSGLLIELIKYCLMYNCCDYNKIITQLQSGVDHSYAKSTCFFEGLAGLALANAYLYKYLGDDEYFKRGMKICDHIVSYQYRSMGRLDLIDPNGGKMSTSFTRVLLGIYYVMDKFLDIISEVNERNRKKKRIRL